MTAPQSARQGARAGGGKSMLSHTKAIEIASMACPEMVKAGAMPCVFVYPEHFIVSWTRVGSLKAPQIHITRGNGSWRHA